MSDTTKTKGMSLGSIAILITYHNEKHLLTDCVSSIVGQQPFEILVYDDASEFPARDYLQPEWGVQVFRGERSRGPGFGRNYLASKARAGYLHFHDADDLFAPGWLQSVGASLSSQWDVVFTEVSSFEEESPSREIGNMVLGGEFSDLKTDLLGFCLKGSLLVPSMTIRKDCFTALGGFGETLSQAEDFDFFLRLALSKPRHTFLPESLVTIRIRRNSRSSNKVNELWHGALAVERAIPRLPSAYHLLAGRRLVAWAVSLGNWGAWSESKAVLAIAEKLGPLDFSAVSGPLRFIAKRLSLSAALWASYHLRGLLPEGLRRLLWGRLRYK